jgi:hypothetical protein
VVSPPLLTRTFTKRPMWKATHSILATVHAKKFVQRCGTGWWCYGIHGILYDCQHGNKLKFSAGAAILAIAISKRSLTYRSLSCSAWRCSGCQVYMRQQQDERLPVHPVSPPPC